MLEVESDHRSNSLARLAIDDVRSTDQMGQEAFVMARRRDDRIHLLVDAEDVLLQSVAGNEDAGEDHTRKYLVEDLFRSAGSEQRVRTSVTPSPVATASELVKAIGTAMASSRTLSAAVPRNARRNEGRAAA